MEQKFVETIKIKDGKVMGLPYHQERMERTIHHFFPQVTEETMPSLAGLLAPKDDMAFYKARVVYGAKGVESIEYAPYSMREIRSLQVVACDDIDYTYKSCDRTALNNLVARKGNYDEIIIVKNGLVTDTSFTNIAIFDGKSWLTPKHPLLKGTKRAALLEQGMIQEADITMADLKAAEKVCLFNAMIEFGERVLNASDIHESF